MIPVRSAQRSYLELAALDTAVPYARRHARSVVTEWGMADIAATLELVTSELVTNSVRACAGLGSAVIRLWLIGEQGSVTVCVWDASSQIPVRKNPAPDDESGRGLLLVESLSAGWGSYRYATGKITWARIRVLFSTASTRQAGTSSPAESTLSYGPTRDSTVTGKKPSRIVKHPHLPGQAGAPPEDPVREGKYARIERERRFLLVGSPAPQAVTARLRITDRYLPGTRLRLRRVEHLDSGDCEFKFTQKVPATRPGYIQGLITNTYLSAAEYDLLASLPAAVLSKTRLSVPPLSVDVFEPPLHGLIMADIEFSADDEAQAFSPPPDAVAEVTDDTRFTGGNLVHARRHDVLTWLAEYGIQLQQTE